MHKHKTYRYAIGVALGAAFMLLVPLVAMQVTEAVNWGPVDFAVAWTLLFATGLAYILVARSVERKAYRGAVGLALAAAFLLAWLSLSVGIIGRDGDPANLMYFGVIAFGVIGAWIARFRPHGMARALFAMALAQTSVAVIAIAARLGLPWSGPLELALLNGFFVALFVGSGLLFRRAAVGQSGRGTA